jgi:hypothetical protein
VTNKGFNRSLFLFLRSKTMGNVDPTLKRPASAWAEAYRLANQTPPAGVGELATAVTVGLTVSEAAQLARQAQQESMDLRDQGHASN